MIGNLDFTVISVVGCEKNNGGTAPGALWQANAPEGRKFVGRCVPPRAFAAVRTSASHALSRVSNQPRVKKSSRQSISTNFHVSRITTHNIEIRTQQPYSTGVFFNTKLTISAQVFLHKTRPNVFTRTGI